MFAQLTVQFSNFYVRYCTATKTFNHWHNLIYIAMVIIYVIAIMLCFQSCCMQMILICILSLFRRWLCYCHVPLFCDSLQRHEVTAIFGQNMLKSIFSLMKQQLLDKFSAEKEKLPPDTRVMVLTYFPRSTNLSLCVFKLAK